MENMYVFISYPLRKDGLDAVISPKKPNQNTQPNDHNPPKNKQIERYFDQIQFQHYSISYRIAGGGGRRLTPPPYD